jgi:predicted dehydrogenase
MPPIRLGIVGPGLIWVNRHRPALETLRDRYSIAAFCAATESRRAEVARDYPDAPFVTDYRAFVQRDDLDAVAVLTPIAFNAPVALAALAAGKHVFLEKPMARTLEEGRALLNATAHSGRRLFVLEQDGFSTRWRILGDLARSGEIGELVVSERVMHWPMDSGQHTQGGYGATQWRIQPDYPLGTLFDGGHHQIAALATVLGAPQAVYATGVALRPEFGEYDHVLMQFVYAGKLRGTFSHSSTLAGKRNYFYIRGTRGLIVAEQDTVTVEMYDGETRSLALPVENTHTIMWRAFAEALVAGEDPVYTERDGFRDLATLFAIERSIKGGQPVSLPL